MRVLGPALAAALAVAAGHAQDRPRPESWTEEGSFDEGWAVSVGRDAPPFALPDADGALHRLSDLAGRPVVLFFWGSW